MKFFAVIPALVFLVSLCGSPVPLGGSATPTASPIPTPTAYAPVLSPLTPPLTATPVVPTSEPSATTRWLPCEASDLAGAFVGFGAAGAHYFPMFGISNVGASQCTLTGPPSLRFLAAGGTAIPIPYTTGTACGGSASQCAQNGPLCEDSNAGCLFSGSLELPSGAPTPHPWPQTQTPAELGQAVLSMGVAVDGLNYGCQPLDPQPATIGLVFPGTGEIDIALAGLASDVPKCWQGVELVDYGIANG